MSVRKASAVRTRKRGSSHLTSVIGAGKKLATADLPTLRDVLR